MGSYGAVLPVEELESADGFRLIQQFFVLECGHSHRLNIRQFEVVIRLCTVVAIPVHSVTNFILHISRCEHSPLDFEHLEVLSAFRTDGSVPAHSVVLECEAVNPHRDRELNNL